MFSTTRESDRQPRPQSTPSLSLSASRRTIKGRYSSGSLQILDHRASHNDMAPQKQVSDDCDSVVVEELVSSAEPSPVKSTKPDPTGGSISRSTNAANVQSHQEADVPAATSFSGTELTFGSLSVRPSSAGRPRHVNLGKKELLGKGSFGMVYRAMDLDTNRILAVKEIPIGPGLLSSQHREQLRKEIQMMQQLNHVNIVKCFGEHWDGDNHLRIFMEYVAGGTISSILRSFGPFSEVQAARFIEQVLQGLAYLHHKKIAHRDLKGDNLLVEVDGTIKLADFGTAKELATRTKSMAGTAFFMAPEVIRGIGHGTSADIWSVGCCVVEMLTGKPPFSTFTNHYAAMMHVAELQVFPTPATLSNSARDFVDRCCRVNPDDRPTAKELIRHPWILSPPIQHDLQTINVVHTTDDDIVVRETFRPTHNPMESLDM